MQTDVEDTMSKKTLVELLLKIAPYDRDSMKDESDRIVIEFVTPFEAELLAGSLKYLRNIQAITLGSKLIIPIDEVNYTLRAFEHDPEPRP